MAIRCINRSEPVGKHRLAIQHPRLPTREARKPKVIIPLGLSSSNKQTAFLGRPTLTGQRRVCGRGVRLGTWRELPNQQRGAQSPERGSNGAISALDSLGKRSGLYPDSARRVTADSWGMSLHSKASAVPTGAELRLRADEPTA
jgi:hypothetical protein